MRGEEGRKRDAPMMNPFCFDVASGISAWRRAILRGYCKVVVSDDRYSRGEFTHAVVAHDVDPTDVESRSSRFGCEERRSELH
jgi:hypothetical protein